MSVKDDWEAHVEGAKAARDSISVCDLDWDNAVLYAAGRIEELEAKYKALRDNCVSLTGSLWPQNETTEYLAKLLEGEK